MAVLAGWVAAGSFASVDPAASGAFIPPGSGVGSGSASSWVAGGHAGYNWQQGSVVFGFEADLQGAHLAPSNRAILHYGPVGVPSPSDIALTSSLIDMYGTLRGRVGFATGPWLFYGTAGLAYGQVDLASQYRTAGALLTAQTSELKAGWVGGIGFEYLVQPNLSLSLGYQYVDLGGVSAGARSLAPFGSMALNSNASGQFQVVMAGISYRFGPSGPTAPWQGAYAGIHGGGAWGNNTDARYDSTLVFSDARLKRDITLLGRRGDGLGIYAFKYQWSDAVHVGVMAQEVALIHPEAVVRDPLTGYMAVDYRMLNAN
jgi:outer membrane immunogenic protein